MDKLSEINFRKELEYLKELKISRKIYRMGMLFNTNFNNYFYDTGTGKVLRLTDNSYKVINTLLSPTESTDDFLCNFESMSNTEKLNFIKVCIHENLFRAPQVKDMILYIGGDAALKKMLYSEARQLVLEVTEKCNFRCKYCIYNEEFEGDRNFGNKDMSFDTAKLAVDYIIQHSKDKVAVTFYGGEPLVKFDLIKATIDYALRKGKNKDLSFSLTSNMTLMTNEMAEYFAKVPGLSMVVSLDGPEEIHNAARVYRNNLGTFGDTMKGLKLIAGYFMKEGKELMINSVLTPPYTYEKIELINDFFEKLEFLPKGTEVRITYPTEGTFKYSESKMEEFNRNPKYEFYNTIDPLLKWQVHKAKKYITDRNKTDIYSKTIIELLASVNNDMQVNKPDSNYRLNSCCIPGGRKLYVKADGNILVCEKIGESPIIGNIYSGLDIEYIKEKYITEYVKKSLPDCSKCWAVNICPSCYCFCYNKEGIDLTEKRRYCDSFLAYLQTRYKIFYSFLEEEPELIDIIKDVVIN